MASRRTILGGRYRLLEPLGQGGLATVHLARDEQLHRNVAVKVLGPEYAADASSAVRFREEARRAASLAHPNIVPVFDFGTEDGTDFIVMQLVEGRDLERVLRQGGPLPPAEALRITGTVTDALHAAHERGIVHGDIKPGNILLTVTGDVQVVDFGIARTVRGATTTAPGVLLGSVHYVSPEQVNGGEAGPASDIYALGLVLWEMLTGRRPYERPTPVATALARLEADLPPPSSIVAGLPAHVDRLVARAVERDPGARFPSAAAFGAMIREVAAALPHSPAPVGTEVAGRPPPVPVRGHAAAPLPGTTVAGPLPGPPARRRGGLRDADTRTWVAPAAGGAAVPAGRAATRPAAGPAPVDASAGEPIDATRPPPGSPAGGTARAHPPATARSRSRGRDGDSWIASAAAVAFIPFLILGIAVVLLGFDPLEPGGNRANDAAGRPEVPAMESPAQGADATVDPAPTPALEPAPEPTPDAEPEPTPEPTPEEDATPPPGRSPAETVVRFYELAVTRNFDGAAALWSEGMRERYPPGEHIDDRFSRTSRMVFNRITQRSLDLASGRAVVDVELTEYRSSGPSPQRFVGYWDLVLGEEGWLLEQPHF
jgi:eukaryotic-like serine/threonine-protein kinase